MRLSHVVSRLLKNISANFHRKLRTSCRDPFIPGQQLSNAADEMAPLAFLLHKDDHLHWQRGEESGGRTQEGVASSALPPYSLERQSNRPIKALPGDAPPPFPLVAEGAPQVLLKVRTSRARLPSR